MGHLDFSLLRAGSLDELLHVRLARAHVACHIPGRRPGQDVPHRGNGAPVFRRPDAKELAHDSLRSEHLIHDESVERLEKAYELTRHETNRSMTFDQASEITYSYMKLFILGDEMGATTSNSRMAQIYPGWQDTKNFAKDILKDTMNEERRDE